MDEVSSLILERLDRMDDDRREARHELLAAIESLTEQVAATNGRLRHLELWRHGLEAVHRANSWLRPAVVAFVMGGSLATLSWILSHY